MNYNIVSVPEKNIKFSYYNLHDTSLRTLTANEIDFVSGAWSFGGALNYARTVYHHAPIEAQFLLHVSTGIVLGFAVGGPVGAAVGGIGGGISFMAT